MDRSAASKIMDTQLAQPTRVCPHPMSNEGVHDDRKERNHTVDAEPHPHRGSAAHNGGVGGREAQIEDILPIKQRGADRIVKVRGWDKVSHPHEAVGRGSVRDAIPDQIKGNGGEEYIANILEHDVDLVPRRRHPDLEHGEAGLHGEDDEGRGEDPRGVVGVHGILVLGVHHVLEDVAVVGDRPAAELAPIARVRVCVRHL